MSFETWIHVLTLHLGCRRRRRAQDIRQGPPDSPQHDHRKAWLAQPVLLHTFVAFIPLLQMTSHTRFTEPVRVALVSLEDLS